MVPFHGTFLHFCWGLHPRRLTWNIIMEVWKIIFLSKWVICRFQPLIFQGVTPWFLVVLPGDIGESWTKVGTLRRCRRGAEVCFHGFFSGDFWEVGRGEDTHTIFIRKDLHLTQENRRNSLPTFARETVFFIGLMNVFRCFFLKHSCPCGFLFANVSWHSEVLVWL